MKRVCVCGHFGFDENLLNGQTVKTKIVTAELERRLGSDEVYKLDTHGGIKALLRLPFQTWQAMYKCKNVIIFPANNGLRVLVPLLVFERLFFKRALHYVVIGGWLPKFIRNKWILSKQLKRFNGIYVETNTIKKALDEQGFNNIVVMPNCKELHILDESELVYSAVEPYKLCTFSRVMKGKGIENAIEAIKTVNEQYCRIVFTLDIYGQIDNNQTEWFDKIQKSFPEYVKYSGLVPFDQSVEVLKKYFALLFPTQFYTEGIPGTVIDAYAAGVPVISSMWESFSDVINNGITGIGYEFKDNNSLKDLLVFFAECPEQVTSMKLNCLKKAEDFSPEKAIDILVRGIGGV